jgi:hypothetical protein
VFYVVSETLILALLLPKPVDRSKQRIMLKYCLLLLLVVAVLCDGFEDGMSVKERAQFYDAQYQRKPVEVGPYRPEPSRGILKASKILGERLKHNQQPGRKLPPSQREPNYDRWNQNRYGQPPIDYSSIQRQQLDEPSWAHRRRSVRYNNVPTIRERADELHYKLRNKPTHGNYVPGAMHTRHDAGKKRAAAPDWRQAGRNRAAEFRGGGKFSIKNRAGILERKLRHGNSNQ